jgi:hypothetical protein
MREGYYYAAFCRRGHVADALIEVGHSSPGPPLPERCGECVARILISCPQCDQRIRGVAKGVIVAQWDPDEFCGKCGAPYPWASRQAMVYDIENRLDEDDSLSEGDRRALREKMAALQEPASGAGVERRQLRALQALRTGAPKVWAGAQPILVQIATSWMKKEMGLPPS